MIAQRCLRYASDSTLSISCTASHGAVRTRLGNEVPTLQGLASHKKKHRLRSIARIMMKLDIMPRMVQFVIATSQPHDIYTL